MGSTGLLPSRASMSISTTSSLSVDPFRQFTRLISMFERMNFGLLPIVFAKDWILRMRWDAQVECTARIELSLRRVSPLDRLDKLGTYFDRSAGYET